jgi:hypothetical protein
VRLSEWLTQGAKAARRRGRERGRADHHLWRPGPLRSIEFARLTRDGKLVEHGKDARFWWQVVKEIDRPQG